MFTTDECRAKAREKTNLAELARKGRRRGRFMSAARAWLFLADHIESVEAELQIARESAKEDVHAFIPEQRDARKAQPQYFERGDAQA
jgi:hypothetical protein